MWTCDYSSLTRAVWLNKLLQFTTLRNHSNVTVFTKTNTLLRFMKVRNLSHVIYLCNQSYLKKESLRRHISAVQWKVIWSKRHILSVHDGKTKLFKWNICEALVLKNQWIIKAIEINIWKINMVESNVRISILDLWGISFHAVVVFCSR